MGLLDLFGKKDVTADLGARFPYYMKTEFVPYKLRSLERSSSALIVTVRNLTGEPVMGSVVISVPRQLSVDSTGLSREKEIRFGSLLPNEQREARFEVFSDVKTDKGEYTITVTAFVHYRDYAHILNSMRKRAVIEAV